MYCYYEDLHLYKLKFYVIGPCLVLYTGLRSFKSNGMFNKLNEHVDDVLVLWSISVLEIIDRYDVFHLLLSLFSIKIDLVYFNV